MYSQNDEEKYILEAVGHIEYGNLIDIGAFDGQTFSNSFALLQRGWRGVLVEPSARAFVGLLTTHGSNGRTHLIHALLGTSSGLRCFWESDGEGVSTTEMQNVEKWCKRVHFTQYNVVAVEWRNVIVEPPDFVSIDAEGSSTELFLAYPFDINRPRCFCVEYDQNEAKVREFALAHGYEVVYQSAENLVMVSQ